MPRPAWGFDLWEAVTPQSAWRLHPDPGTPGSQVATVLGKISFKKPVSFFLFLFLPNMTVFQMGK